MDVDNSVVMRELTRMVMQTITQDIANKARQFAVDLPEEVSGHDALMALAEAIESTNDKVLRGEGGNA